MGENGLNWMIKDYSWHTIAKKMNDSYKWIDSYNITKPEFIFEF